MGRRIIIQQQDKGELHEAVQKEVRQMQTVKSALSAESDSLARTVETQKEEHRERMGVLDAEFGARRTEISNEIEKLENGRDDLVSANATLAKENANLSSLNYGLATSRAKAEKEVANLEDERGTLASELRQTSELVRIGRKELADLDARISALASREISLASSLASVEGSIGKMNAELSSISSLIEPKRNELETIKAEILLKSETLGKTVRAIEAKTVEASSLDTAISERKAEDAAIDAERKRKDDELNEKIQNFSILEQRVMERMEGVAEREKILKVNRLEKSIA